MMIDSSRIIIIIKKVTRKARVLNLTLIPCKENKIKICMYFLYQETSTLYKRVAIIMLFFFIISSPSVKGN